MIQVPSEQIVALQDKILDRYATHKRELPRRDTGDPYKVLVSEVMLQQTQVDRVVPKFERWVDELPTI
jgi:A/G-specific adenine glycosylase